MDFLMLRSALPKRLSAGVVAALLMAVGFVGCDFQRYDHGADAPTASHLQALATADSPSEAKDAIRAALNKVGVDWARKGTQTSDGYAAYVPSSEALDAIATLQAAYVRGEHEGFTLQESYDRVLAGDATVKAIDQESSNPVSESRGDITVPAEDAALYLSSATSAALQHPETAESALLLLTASKGKTVEEVARTLSVTDRLSPVQQLFFMMWLHRNGPSMVAMPESLELQPGEAPASQATKGAVDVTLSAQRTGGGGSNECCPGSDGKVTDLTLLYLGPTANVKAEVVTPSPKYYLARSSAPLAFGEVFTLTGAGRTGAGGHSGTLGNELLLSINGQADVQLHTSCSQPIYAGQIYGHFYVLAVNTKNGPGCNNLSLCLLGCKAQFIACVGCDPSEVEFQECKQEYRECDLNCHDQGGGR